MNERIRKLIRNLDNKIGRYYWTDEEKEKFAELIVRECIQAVYDDEYYQDRIKNHFGVE
jgi:hypothetical protein